MRKEETSVVPLGALKSLLKTVWVMITGGAFVGLAGSALVLIYFWGIGGVPIGQAASLGAMSQVVLPTAIFLSISFIMVWLIPTAASFIFMGEQKFVEILRQIFSIKENILTKVAQDESAESSERLTGAKAEKSFHASVAKISILRIAVFSLLTVGFSAVATTIYMVLVVLQYFESPNKSSEWFFAISWAVGQAILLWLMWKIFSGKRSKNGRTITLNTSHASAWYALGFLSSTLSVAPLILLLLMFLRSDVLLGSESPATLAGGMLAISFGIFLAYTISLWALIERAHGEHTKWMVVLGTNAMVLAIVVISLGMSSRMLELIMVLASIRVEHSVIVLETEGCELLDSMGIKSWNASEQSERLCVLPNVTIQSTLEPSIQIACWRGVLPVSTKNEDAETKKEDLFQNEIKDNPSISNSVRYIAQITGQRGAFGVPIKYVRAIWKTGGVKVSSQESLCPTKIDYLRLK